MLNWKRSLKQEENAKKKIKMRQLEFLQTHGEGKVGSHAFICLEEFVSLQGPILKDYFGGLVIKKTVKIWDDKQIKKPLSCKIHSPTRRVNPKDTIAKIIHEEYPS